MDKPRGWHSRGYLPHLDLGQVPQFVTWRLEDSLPMELYLQWKEELRLEEDWRRKLELYRRVERYLDQGKGSCILQELSRREIVGSALRFYHRRRYILHAYSVMPNHMHTLFTPMKGQALGSIIRSLKSYTSREIHKAFGGEGQLWQTEYFDRMMRSEEHLARTAKYIEWNPVKAKLTHDPKLWMQTSLSCPID